MATFSFDSAHPAIASNHYMRTHDQEELFRVAREEGRAGPRPRAKGPPKDAGGRSAGYVPVTEVYETGGYEVRVSPYSEDAEAMLRAGFLDLLKALP